MYNCQLRCPQEDQGLSARQRGADSSPTLLMLHKRNTEGQKKAGEHFKDLQFRFIMWLLIFLKMAETSKKSKNIYFSQITFIPQSL